MLCGSQEIYTFQHNLKLYIWHWREKKMKEKKKEKVCGWRNKRRVHGL